MQDGQSDIVALSACLRAVHRVAKQRPESVCEYSGCELVVRVEQRDGPVAGREGFVEAFAFAEQRDAALYFI